MKFQLILSSFFLFLLYKTKTEIYKLIFCFTIFICRNANAPTRTFLNSVATRAANQIAKYRGTHYTVGTSASILYEASGGLDDFAYGNLGIPMSFTLELPGDNFAVATSDILHVCKETFAGFVEFIRHVSLY